MFRFFISGLVVTLTMATLNSIDSPTANGQDVGFLERFALSEDRESTLSELVPGTDGYYFYHCLHYQNTQQFDKAADAIAKWEKRRGETNQIKEMKHRQALLTYTNTPEDTVRYLMEELKVRHNHQRRQPTAEPGLPTVLDQSLISFERLNKRALDRNNLNRYEEIALIVAATQELSASQLRSLLKKLNHPSVPDLPKLIARDLKASDAQRFGSYTVHNLLTLAQLDELARLVPDLKNETDFVNNYLLRLQPNADVLPELEQDENLALLERLWDFASDRNANHNSLKANILFRRLVLDRKMGVYDKARFLEYLKLPRSVAYINRRLVERVRNNRHLVQLGADYRKFCGLLPINNDEPLVRHFLHHFLVDANDYEEFKPLIEDGYLKERFAEARITAGLGDSERWASMLSPSKYQELMKRIDLEFAHTNPDSFEVDEKVEIKLTTKNVKNLIVKIFEINTANFYRNNEGQIDTDINLDGLVPNWQKTLAFDEAPIRRVERTFSFEEIDHRGVFIVDFIGSGKSSRVMIRKGQLHHVVETTAAGQLVSILNEQHQLVKDATLWVAGRDYPADENGQFLIPFSNQPKTESMIMQFDGLSVRGKFNHLSEAYSLRAGIHVDRESLLKSGKAKVLVRPQLRVAGQPTSLSLVDKVRLIVRATDLDGVEATREFSGLELSESVDTAVEIMVPARLSTIQFELRGNVQVVSRGTPQELVADQTFNVNRINKTETLQAVHLRQNENGYVLAVRGKTGESRKAQAVQVKLKHRLFTDTVTANLQSDAKGQIVLGELKDIARIDVALNGRNQRTWYLQNSEQTTYDSINTSTEQAIQIPFDTGLSEVSFALTEIRGGSYFKDESEKITLADGLISIAPLQPGDYELLNQWNGQRQRIRVTKGDQKGTYVAGKWRMLEMRHQQPLHIKDVEVAESKVRIKLGGSSESSRVHVIATRYQPRFDPFLQFVSVGDIEPIVLRKSISLSGYVAGRSIGEEYQYILERQLAEKYPGNMLNRPSLLLNPWELRTTDNDLQIAQDGEVFRRGAASKPGGASRSKKRAAGAATNTDFANLDFLADGSVVLENLAADENGEIEIDAARFGDKHMLQVVVQNEFHTLVRRVHLPEQPLAYRDLRLAKGLDPERHFAQQKQYTVLKAGTPFELQDFSSARLQNYDDLSDVYRYYITLTGNAQLAEFGFLMDWPKKSEEEKLELYKRHACHEFNFFLMKKDPEYFGTVIVPYLANKLHKTFLDQYLLDLQLEAWVEPWEFKRLNTAEQILLGRRVDDHRERLNQLIGDDYDNHPTSRREFDRLYDFAVAGSALDTDKYKSSSEAGESEEALLYEGEKQDGQSDQDGDAAIPQPENSVSRARPRRQGKSDSNEMFSDELKRAESPREDSTRLGRGLANRPASTMEQFGGVVMGGGGQAGGGGRGRRLREARQQVKQYYQRIKPTSEWVESNYYRLPIEQQNSQLVRVNRFWKDYALHSNDEPFLSPFFAESSRNFTEMMLALAVIDLPFETPEHEVEYDEDTMVMTPANDLIAFYQQVRPSAFDRGESTVLISENFYRSDDRYQVIDSKQREKFVRKEFLANVMYGGQIVITNPTSTPQDIDLLVQIPEGALPAQGSHETKAMQMDLGAFSTQTLEYYFYFPTPGDFAHFPAHVSVDSATVAIAEGLRFNVVESLSEVDTESWAYVSQNGSAQQVLDYLASENLQQVDLGMIAFRMGNEEFYKQAIDLLTERFAYNHTLWSYSLKYNDTDVISQYLQHNDQFVNQCGTWLTSPVLDIQPVIRNMYQHREYWPLVNARAHQLGNTRKILNNAIWQQYRSLLQIMSRQTKPGDEEHLVTAHYLLLQDRVSEAIEHFEKVSRNKIDMKLQYDYCAVYIAMYQEQPEQADKIAKQYTTHPVKRWREMFAAVSAQVKEINGGETEVVDRLDPNQRQTEAASKTPGFEFVVESLKTKLSYQNLDEVTVNYYQMDVELLFSRNPFVQKQDDSYAMIKPNESAVISLPDDQNLFDIPLPEKFTTSNVLVEVVGGGKTSRQAYYANTMNVQTIEQFGQLAVAKTESGESLSKVYVKVYARKADGSVHFYKDGYTDLRGRFDYASLSNQNLNDVDRFSILVISSDHGAVVREAVPPKQ